MAKMTVKSTFTLDKETAEGIRSLALGWKVSQAEVIRKSVALALVESQLSLSRSPLQILESLEKRKRGTNQEEQGFKKSMKANKKGWS